MSDLWIANWSSLLGAVTSFKAYAITGPYINMWIKKKSWSWWHNLFFGHKLFYVLSSHKCSIAVNQGKWIKQDANFSSYGCSASLRIICCMQSTQQAKISKLYKSFQRFLVLIETTNISHHVSQELFFTPKDSQEHMKKLLRISIRWFEGSKK